MPIKVNGINVENVIVNGVRYNKVTVNNVTVWQQRNRQAYKESTSPVNKTK